jgi:hypothetical protein
MFPSLQIQKQMEGCRQDGIAQFAGTRFPAAQT